jgi:hypothetical protein
VSRDEDAPASLSIGWEFWQVPPPGKEAKPPPVPDLKWYQRARGLFFWIAVLVWLSCILYPWVARLIAG